MLNHQVRIEGDSVKKVVKGKTESDVKVKDTLNFETANSPPKMLRNDKFGGIDEKVLQFYLPPHCQIFV
jgi:hypothetical protein